MDPTIIKSNKPYITRHKLGRTPASEEARQRAKFIDEHDFSIEVDKKTRKLTCNVTKKG